MPKDTPDDSLLTERLSFRISGNLYDLLNDVRRRRGDSINVVRLKRWFIVTLRAASNVAFDGAGAPLRNQRQANGWFFMLEGNGKCLV